MNCTHCVVAQLAPQVVQRTLCRPQILILARPLLLDAVHLQKHTKVGTKIDREGINDLRRMPEASDLTCKLWPKFSRRHCSKFYCEASGRTFQACPYLELQILDARLQFLMLLLEFSSSMCILIVCSANPFPCTTPIVIIS